VYRCPDRAFQPDRLAAIIRNLGKACEIIKKVIRNYQQIIRNSSKIHQTFIKIPQKSMELEPYNPYIPQTWHIMSSFWCLSKGKLPVVAASIGFADPEAMPRFRVLSYGFDLHHVTHTIYVTCKYM